ncbi:hypothetical protein J7K42_00685 [bacterium]|nr:hypothetical protein [bacterium]
MDFNEIKNLRPQNGERYIVVENGKPILVLMSFEDYEKFFFRGQKEIKFKEKLTANPSSEKALEKNSGELTLEDLPF